MAYTFASSYSAPIIVLYLLMIWQCRRLMKAFAPLDLRRVLMAHNLICSLLSLYAVVFFLVGLWKVAITSAHCICMVSNIAALVSDKGSLEIRTTSY